MMVRVIDIETTGIDPAKDAIVEVASVDLTHEKAITNKGDLEAWHWPGAMLPLSGGKLTDYSRRRESRSCKGLRMPAVGDRSHTRRRPASANLQCTKSRKAEHPAAAGLYGDLMGNGGAADPASGSLCH